MLVQAVQVSWSQKVFFTRFAKVIDMWKCTLIHSVLLEFLQQFDIFVFDKKWELWIYIVQSNEKMGGLAARSQE